MKAGIAVVLLVLTALAQAETLTKCVDGQGRVTWTNQRCQAGETASAVNVEPVVADSSELRAWARRSPARPTAPVRARQVAERYIDPLECGNARRAYEFELGWKHSKPKALAYRRKQVCQVCGKCP